jgi:hypothetical protein
MRKWPPRSRWMMYGLLCSLRYGWIERKSRVGHRSCLLFIMDMRKWLSPAAAHRCVYCSRLADTSDHTPPRCLLPRPLPDRVQVMTVRSCRSCNDGYSQDEQKTAAVICTVSFLEEDRHALASGGWLHSTMQKDASLRDFISTRLGDDGIFRPDREVIDVISRIMTKTTLGLLLHEFCRLVPLKDIRFLDVEHSRDVHPSAFVERHRRDDHLWAEVSPSVRMLRRSVIAETGFAPPNMGRWHTYVPSCLEYMPIRRSNDKLLMALNVHDALVFLFECPWPARAGPRRGGKPPIRPSRQPSSPR